VGAATNLISNSLSRVASAVGGSDVPSKRLSRNVSFENEEAYLGSLATATNTITNPTSPERLSRQPTIVSSEEESEEEVDIPEEPKDEEEEDMEDDDEEDDDEEEDDDDDDEDDEDVQPPSQYISALDLAGF
jgi:TATA-binding protein-associated factor Taf7